MTQPSKGPESTTPGRIAPRPVVERYAIEELPEALAGQRIDRIVAIVADVTRSHASQLIAEGAVVIDGAVVERGSQRGEAGSALVIELERVDDRPKPDGDVAFDVIHEDDSIVVVDKPAGLVVHPGSGVTGATLANGLLARFPEIADVGEAQRPGIVHRLDRGTSGLLMVARNEAARRHLSRQLAERSVERRYRTLVLGHVEAEAGVVDAPLGRSPHDPTRRAVVADGRPARTRYQVESRMTAGGADELAVTLLTCELETGRTHQIRAHLTAIGHPVVGDTVYGGSVAGSPIATVASRPFLHAEVLGFEHPVTAERLRFSSMLPADLRAVLAALSGGPAHR